MTFHCSKSQLRDLLSSLSQHCVKTSVLGTALPLDLGFFQSKSHRWLISVPGASSSELAKLRHCGLTNGSKPRARAAPPSALPLSHYPSWECLQNPLSASPPLEPPPAPVSLPLGRLAQNWHLPFQTAPETQPSGARFSFSFSRPPRSKLRIETELGFMQQEPAPAGSLGSQQDSALPRAPTMPPPGSSKSHQPSPDHSPTEVLRGLGRWGLFRLR